MNNPIPLCSSHYEEWCSSSHFKIGVAFEGPQSGCHFCKIARDDAEKSERAASAEYADRREAAELAVERAWERNR